MTSRAPLALRRPLVLTRFPATFVAIAAASTILVAAGAAGPLFRSATGTASVRLEIGRTGGEAISISTSGPLAADVVAFQQRQLQEGLLSVPGLGEPVATFVGSAAAARSVAAAHPAGIRLAFRTGFASHVEVVAGSSQGAPGIWISDRTARELEVGSGDHVTISLGGRTVSVQVAAVYHDLAGSKSEPFWAPLASSIYTAGQGSATPPALALADRSEFLQLTTELEDSGRYGWSASLTPRATRGITFGRALALASGLSRLQERLGDPADQLGSALGQPTASSPIPDAIASAVGAQRTIAGPIDTLAMTGQLVALFGMLAAGVYGIRRRRTEMRALDAMGTRWSRIAGRGAVEAILPVVAGGAAGWLAANVLIRRFGPADTIEASALRDSIRDGVVAGAIAVAVLGVVAAVAARGEAADAASGRVRRLGQNLLWEVPVLALAAAALYEIGTRGTAPFSTTGDSVHVDRLLLLFPILFIAGFGGLAVRGLGRLLAGLRGSSSSWPVPLYLASRRLSAAPRIALLLVTASCLAIGVLTYAGTTVATIRATTLDKVMISVGADVAAPTAGPIFPPQPGQGIRTTNVMEIPFVAVGDQGQGVTVIGVEPRTLASVAFWDPGFASRPLPELMGMLRGAGEPLPAIVVNGSLPPAATLGLAGYRVPLRVVASASAFPVEHRGVNVVVSAPRLRALLASHGATLSLLNASYRALASGDPGIARAFLVSSGADPVTIIDARSRLDRPGFHALSWAFGFMEVLGIVTALVALIGLLLYLQARQRARILSYALTRRMGLTSGAHRAAVAAELAGLLVAALVIGSALSFAAVAVVYRRLDPLPNLPPSPIIRLPIALLGWAAIAVVACAWIGATIVQWRVGRADVGAVMRFAD
jgi:putative ABC transport system permease protein